LIARDRPEPPEHPERVSFAQNGEDIRLLRVLGCVTNGFFVDVGAADPVIGSVTNLFMVRGWHGINVEPGPLFDKLETHRADDVNLNCVVGREHATVPFHITYPDTGLSTTDLAFHDRSMDGIQRYETVQREQRPLSDILLCHAAEREIHFLKVDTEGSEAEVLASNDWTRFRPWIVVVESIASWSREATHEAWEPDLLDAGYIPAGFDGINRFYVAAEHSEYAEALAYPLSALDQYVTADYSDLAERLAQAQALRDSAESAAVEAEALAREAVTARRISTDRLMRELAVAVERTRVADLEREQALRERDEQRRVLEAMTNTRVWRTGTKVRRVAGPVKGVLRPIRGLRLASPRSKRRRSPSEDDTTRQASSGDASPGSPPPTHFPDASPELQRLCRLLPCPVRLVDRSEAARLLAGGRLATYLSSQDAQRKTLPADLRGALNELQLACALRLSGDQDWRPPSPPNPVVATDIVVDLRCLQDPGYRHRGVGFHAASTLAVLRHSASDLNIAGLLDPALPDIAPEARGLVDRVVFSAGHVQVETTQLFVCLSPFTAGLGPAVPFLLSPTTRTQALIYDFIPAELPARYLNSPEAALRYSARLNILAQFDYGLAISEATAVAARHLLGWEAHRIRVTGVADHLPEAVRSSKESQRRFVIAPTGGDERKNLRTAVAAFGRAFGRSSDLALHIVGSIPSSWESTLVAVAEEHGVHADRLVFRSELSDQQLAQTYCDAEVAIIPSLAEGFSIPVVEAVRRGCPVVASDIPAHRELLGEGWWLAMPGDASGQAAALTRAVRDRDETSKIQRSAVEARYAPNRVAELTATAFDEVLSRPRTATRRPFRTRTRPRIGVISPLPQHASGIADYTIHTLSGLSEYADVAFIPSVRDPVDLRRGQVERFRYDRLLPGRFDRTIAVVGNSHFHVTVLDYLGQWGAAVIAHDTRMAEYCTSFEDSSGARRILGLPAGATQEQMNAYLAELDDMPTSGYNDIARLASPLIVHSPRLRDRILIETGVSATVVPFVPYNVPGHPMTVHDYVSARRRLGLNEAVTHVVVLGGVDTRTKAIDIVIRSLGWLEAWGRNYLLHIVGDLPLHERVTLERIIIELGLHQRVEFSGRAPWREVHDYMMGADLAVQLRTASVLSLSGAFADAIAYGLPTIATTALGSDHEAPFYVHTVPTTATPILVAESLDALRAMRRERFDEIEDARLEYLARHNARGYARGVAVALGIVEE
jgi:FkbM family methyltransferase